jgi:RNA polymerase sigma-70 factor (ECF subfamily)
LTTDLNHHSSSGDCLSHNAALREQFALLDEALHRLPDAQRSAWVLTELEGLSQAQISEIEGVPEGIVKSRVSRARETLLNTLQNEIGMER